MGNSGPCSAEGVLNRTGCVKAWWSQPFGCRCYYSPQTDAKLSALSRRGLPGIFVGYAKHLNSKGYLIYVPGRDKLVISSDVTFHPHEMPFLEGAVLWNEQARSGEWAPKFADPSSILESVIYETNLRDREQIGPTIDEAANADDPDGSFTSLHGPRQKSKGANKSLQYSKNRSTKGLTTANKPSADEVRAWARQGFTCIFNQQHSKGGASNDRYQQYKTCSTMAEFLEKFPKWIGDLQNDIGKGLCTISPPTGDISAEAEPEAIM